MLAAVSSAREAERNGLSGISKLAKTAAQNAWNAKIAMASIACHWANFSIGETDSVSRARKVGIKLRIDIVDEAVDAMIGELTKTSGDDNIRSKLWGMNDTAVQLVALTAKRKTSPTP